MVARFAQALIPPFHRQNTTLALHNATKGRIEIDSHLTDEGECCLLEISTPASHHTALSTTSKRKPEPAE